MAVHRRSVHAASSARRCAAARWWLDALLSRLLSGTMIGMALRRERDPELEPFRDGMAVLRSDNGEVAGYLWTTLDEFWSPGRPLTWQQCVWYEVIWADGRRERVEEDYPPWTLVDEVRQGRVELEVGGEAATAATYTAEWLEGDARDKVRETYRIRDKDR